MRRSAEDDLHGGPSKRYHSANPGVPDTRHVFKVLVPDNMAGSMLVSKGALKDDIQRQTGTKLIFSNRGDYFPNTQLRVLGIFCDDPECILSALESLVDKLIELGEEERRSPPGGKGDRKGGDAEGLLGKESGEYIFRLCITREIAGLLIGSGGTNIKELRSQSRAKVFIENETMREHRLVRVIGGHKEIMSALGYLNEYVQQESDSEAFIATYASIINFGAIVEDGEEDSHSWAPGGNSADRGGRERSGRRSGKGEDRMQEDTPAPRGGPPRAVLKGLDFLADAIHAMPEDKPGLTYAMSCDVPESMAGPLDEYARDVEEETYVTIKLERIEGHRLSALIEGSMPWIFAAHALLVQRLSTLKAEAASKGARRFQDVSQSEEDPETLKRQIAELQNKLNRAIR